MLKDRPSRANRQAVPPRNGRAAPQIVRHPNADDLRLPPHNIEAEQQCLGACLISADAIAAVRAKVEPRDFYRDVHQVIFRSILELDGQGKPVDSLTLADELQRLGVLERIGGEEVIADLAKAAPHAENAAHHADIIRGKSRLRDLIEVSEAASREAYEQRDTTEAILERAAERLNAIQGRGADHGADEVQVDDSWPVMDPAAYHGIAGEFVRLVEPETEADPVAVLVQFLVAFANLVGRYPHFKVSSTSHYLCLNAALVGPTAAGRKGTSWDLVLDLLRRIDDVWAGTRIRGGMISGEGLIHHVRDQVVKADGQVIDPGVDDKRLLVIETELSRVFKVMARDGNVLSMQLRECWDCSPVLGTMGKNSPSRATNPHISVIGHITKADLVQDLTSTDSANGFGNRFLWIASRRSKLLPDGGNIDGLGHQLNAIVQRLREAAELACGVGKMTRDPGARALWHEVYGDLSAGRPGLLGAVLGRAEAQVMRLACVYALLDRMNDVRAEHLRAALALWRYCEASARYVFTGRFVDPDAEKLLASLRAAEDGLTKTEIRKVFARHKSKEQLGKLLSDMVSDGLIYNRREQGAGRPAERWYAGQDQCAKRGT